MGGRGAGGGRASAADDHRFPEAGEALLALPARVPEVPRLRGGQRRRLKPGGRGKQRPYHRFPRVGFGLAVWERDKFP